MGGRGKSAFYFFLPPQLRGALVEWLERLCMVQEVAVKRKFETGLHHATVGKLCQPSSEWVPFFELGKDKAAKLRLSSAAPKIQWDSNPHCPYGFRLWETCTLTFSSTAGRVNSNRVGNHVI